jgi:hypothetical protein
VQGVDALSAGDHEHPDHPHAGMETAPPAKSFAPFTANFVRVVELVLAPTRDQRRIVLVYTSVLSPGCLTHGPPPPSRAPPRV